MKEKESYIGIYADREEKEAIQKIAREMDLTMSQLIRRIIREWLSKRS